MKRKGISIIILGTFLICSSLAHAQLTGFIKTGLNFGTINQDWLISGTDSIKYGKPLIRPIVSMGVQLALTKNWFIRQELMFQIKGQGTIRPDTRSGFLTEGPDFLRFVSLPFTIHRKFIQNLYIGIGVQPSLFLSGEENYTAKEKWHGWIWSGNLNIQYFIEDALELGFEYDYDFRLYYCPGCDERFYTYRLYGAYHFL
ncbi:MAG: outer membrane beta-barrel protein [Saprospiraceae bacterium]